MSAIPSKDTKPEIALRKALWHEKLRYRVNYKKLPGKPDIVFTKYRIAVFCDGDFWHGHEFWQTKIRRNIERDNEVNQMLTALGWTVIRIWESDINKDISKCVETIKRAINSAQQ